MEDGGGYNDNLRIRMGLTENKNRMKQRWGPSKAWHSKSGTPSSAGPRQVAWRDWMSVDLDFFGVLWVYMQQGMVMVMILEGYCL